MIPLFILTSIFHYSAGQLDLSSIKKQQTYPAGSSTVTVPTTTVGPCNVGCQDDWIPYGGNCYKKMLDVLSQQSAEQECVHLGAHLVSFETAAEATAVKSLVLEAPLFSSDLLSSFKTSQASWIGLSKTANGAWTWTDSSDVEFTNLPDGTTIADASCVYMNITGAWQPTSCSSTATSFICKRPSFLK